MKTKLLVLVLLAGGSMFAQTRFSIGVSIGGNGRGYYPPAPSYASIVPPCPGPDYSWVDGYWSQERGRNTWMDGYWMRRPSAASRMAAPRVEPRYDNRYNDSHGRQDRAHENNNRNQDRGYGHDNRGNGFSNGFRSR